MTVEVPPPSPASDRPRGSSGACRLPPIDVDLGVVLDAASIEVFAGPAAITDALALDAAEWTVWPPTATDFPSPSRSMSAALGVPRPVTRRTDMATVKFDTASRIYPGTNRAAVDRLDLDVKDGEFLVLVGPSGCGKSTSLRMLAGLEEVNEGSIYIGDDDVTELPPKKPTSRWCSRTTRCTRR